jgi:hypothetical protein
MPILVQSFLNSATKLSTTATTATTVAQLKTLVNVLEGVSTSTMQFYIVNPSTTSTALVSGTLGSYGITTATTIYSSNSISTLAIASGTTLTKNVNPPHSNVEIVAPFSAIWSLNYVGALGATNDVSYKLYVTSLGIGSAVTLTSHQTGDYAVTAGNFLYDEYGNSIGIIKGNTTIDNYMAKAAAVCGSLSNTIITAATYKGTWNAFSDTPTLTDGAGTLGDAYDVTTSGTSGEYPEYLEQDWRIYDGSVWQRVAKTTTTQWTIAPAAAGQADKATRQLAKLELAQLRRQAGRITTATFYRIRNVYNIDLLADKYTSPTSTIGTTSTLSIGRPWPPVLGMDDPANIAEPEATAWVLMDGPYGDEYGFYAGQSWRKLAPIGYSPWSASPPYPADTYTYGSETVRFDGTVWVYENLTGVIATGGGLGQYPWQATWTGSYTAAKVTSTYVKTTNYPTVP